MNADSKFRLCACVAEVNNENMNPGIILLFQILFLSHHICGFLDFEELKSVNYGINLLDTPVVKQDVSEDLHFSLNGNKQYCCFP